MFPGIGNNNKHEPIIQTDREVEVKLREKK